MTDRETDERLLALCDLADRLRLPSHRLTAEQVYGAQQELRDGLRRFYRDRTGAFPEAIDPEMRRGRAREKCRIRSWRG